MTQELQRRLIDVGNALARSLGHIPGCPKLSPVVPCYCVAAQQQAQALSDWSHLMRDIEGDTPSHDPA